jgi:transposase
VVVDGVLRLEAVALVAGGMSPGEAARRLGLGVRSVQRWAKLAGMTLQRGRKGGLAELRPAEWRKHPDPRLVPDGPYVDGNGRLDLTGRTVIQVRLREQRTHREIAAEIGVAASTVCREVAGHRIGGVYRAKVAHRTAVAARSREPVRWSV